MDASKEKPIQKCAQCNGLIEGRIRKLHLCDKCLHLREKEQGRAGYHRKKDQRKKYRDTHKEKTKEYNRIYREAHREKENEYRRKYYNANRDKILENCKKYREANIEKMLRRCRKYYETHKNKIKEYRKKNKAEIEEYNRKYHKAHREREKECSRKWRKENREKVREVARKRSLKCLYGITLDKYNEILNSQGGVCAICKGVNKTGKSLFVDHDHKTGKVRGLLCHRCNIVLGHARDEINILEKAIDYLRITA